MSHIFNHFSDVIFWNWILQQIKKIEEIIEKDVKEYMQGNKQEWESRKGWAP